MPRIERSTIDLATRKVLLDNVDVLAREFNLTQEEKELGRNKERLAKSQTNYKRGVESCTVTAGIVLKTSHGKKRSSSSATSVRILKKGGWTLILSMAGAIVVRK